MLETQTDRLGRPYTPFMDPAVRLGQHPPNYGKKYPAEILNAEEVAALLAACSRTKKAGLRARAAFALMWRCGLRVGELVELLPSDLDADRGSLLVREGKNRRRRVVGIDAQTAQVVAEWQDVRAQLHPPRGAPLLCTFQTGNIGGRLGTPFVRECIKHYAAVAGIQKRVHPHGLRHTFAVDLLMEGVPLTIIQKLLGHKDLPTTAIYLDHLYPGQAIEAAASRVWPDVVA